MWVCLRKSIETATIFIIRSRAVTGSREVTKRRDIRSRDIKISEKKQRGGALNVYDEFISPESEHYIYSPSVTAQKAFFYPVCTGHFIYKPQYRLYRDSYDSFLIMYIQSGEMIIELGKKKEKAEAEKFVLIDCYKPHSYYTEKGCESIWCHFDGPPARTYYELAESHHGNVFSVTDSCPAVKKRMAVYSREEDD